MVWCLINLSGEPGLAHSDPAYPVHEAVQGRSFDRRVRCPTP
jgi:hypothetical protein